MRRSLFLVRQSYQLLLDYALTNPFCFLLIGTHFKYPFADSTAKSVRAVRSDTPNLTDTSLLVSTTEGLSLMSLRICI